VNQKLLIDTGPLVAYLDRRDAFHPWARETFKAVPPLFLTCEAVITETCFLLQRLPRALDQIARWLADGRLRIEFSLEPACPRVFQLMAKYRNLPMSLADACLVAMIERGIGQRVLTLDDHFRLYRHSGRRVVPVLMPE
jgi:predicted nucleic acid-binding protein